MARTLFFLISHTHTKKGYFIGLWLRSSTANSIKVFIPHFHSQNCQTSTFNLQNKIIWKHLPSKETPANISQQHNLLICVIYCQYYYYRVEINFVWLNLYQGPSLKVAAKPKKPNPEISDSQKTRYNIRKFKVCDTRVLPLNQVWNFKPWCKYNLTVHVD